MYSRLISCLSVSLALLTLAIPLNGQNRVSFGDQLLQATHAASTDELHVLIQSDRLGVKPAIGEITEQFIEARRSGDNDRAQQLLRAVTRVSSEFEMLFGERSLSIRTGYLEHWSDMELEKKHHADSLLAAGITIRLGDTREQAYELYLKAEQLFTEIGDEAGLAEVTGQKGYINWWLDRDQYLELNTQALERRRSIDDHQLIGNSLNDVGLYHRAISRNYERALESYLEGEQIRWQIGDSTALSRMLPNIGVSYEGVGDYSRAQEYYLTAADLYLVLGDSARAIGQRNNAASILTDYLGRHSEAKSIFLGLREELEAIDDDRTWALVLNSIGIVNRRLGDYDAAIENYSEVVRISEEHGFSDLLGHALNNIGVVLLWVDRPNRSVAYFERALAQYRDEDRRESVVNALLNLGSAHYEMREYEPSETFLSEALVENDSLSDPISKASILTALGNTRLEASGSDAAVPAYEAALEIAEMYEVPELKMAVLFGLGDAAERAGDASTALAYYNRGFSTIEDSRGLMRAEEDKAGYIAQSRYLFEDVIHFLTEETLETGDAKWAEAAFHFAERSKARSFLDQLAESLAGVSEGIDPELLSEQQNLTENLAYVRDELEQLDPVEDADQIAEFKQMMREQETDFERLEREIRDKNPRYAELQYPDPIDVAGTQSQLLGPEDLLLQYAVGDSSSTLWVVGKNTFSSYQLPPRDDLQRQVDLIRFELTNTVQSTVESFGRAARRLYASILAPAAQEIADADNLIIVPDDVLHYLPFEVLLEEDPQDGQTFSDLSYLIRSVSIRYGQSASVLRTLANQSDEQSDPTQELLAIGDPVFESGGESDQLRSGLEPLPYSGAEVTSIASLFESEQSSVFLQESATESNIRASMESDTYRFIHIATHGLINDDRPDYSALVFSANDDGNDGLLQAAEIFNMKVKADLIVLSACETGLGQLVRGEGMVGLTRAFMYAGTPSVVVSLWKVADQSTAQLMEHFYRSMVKQNASKVEALKMAKLELIATEEIAHPFHWAPFILVGDWK